jgi:hypothetical protein
MSPEVSAWIAVQTKLAYRVGLSPARGQSRTAGDLEEIRGRARVQGSRGFFHYLVLC